MKLDIVQIYQKEMNIYGDSGNREIIEYRLRKRGIDYTTHIVNVGEPLPKNVDILIGGGGQDSGQILVENDILSKKDTLNRLVSEGTVMLLVCGMYQLFGNEFITSDNRIIKGLGILPVSTKASTKRLIGNVLVRSDFGDLYGYENHSGLTTLDNGAKSLGSVIKGNGNNGEDKSEGCILNNVFATYLHGPILSKNPELADELIKRALKKRNYLDPLSELDDSIEMQAKEAVIRRLK